MIPHKELDKIEKKIENVQYEYAEKDGKLIHISDLSEEDRWKGYIYTCPICKQKMLAKLGEVKTWHFAHESESKICTRETILHFNIKYDLYWKLVSLLSKGRGYYVDVMCKYGNTHRINLLENITDVKVEEYYKDVKPDISLYNNQELKSIIEVVVTNYPDKVCNLDVPVYILIASDPINIFFINRVKPVEDVMRFYDYDAKNYDRSIQRNRVINFSCNCTPSRHMPNICSEEFEFPAIKSSLFAKDDILSKEITPSSLNLPYEKWRKYQDIVIGKVIKYIDDYDYFILELPTGAGKSGIAVAISNLLNARTFICVKTKDLQDQYRNSFNYVQVVKGAGNFPCINELEYMCNEKGICRKRMCPYIDEVRIPCIDKNTTCDEGICRVIRNYDCIFKHLCLYYYQKQRALNSRIVCMSYPYYLYELNYIGGFTSRGMNLADLCIFDEAHRIDEQITNFVSLEVSKRRIEKYNLGTPKNDSEKNVIEWLKNVAGKIEENIKTLNIEDERQRKEYLSLSRLLSKVNFLIKEYNDEEWCVYIDENVVFKPVWGGKLFNEYLFNHARKFIMMSATIGDKEQFCSLLGLDKEQVKMIKAPATFYPEIYLLPRVDMVHKNDLYFSNMPYMCKKIDEVIEKYHKNDKGLIHTVNYELAEYILNNSIFKYRMVGHDSDSRGLALENFKKDREPLILVSPSMYEGIDLKYDLCRFIIQAKNPYPDFGDKIVRKRKRQNIMWYYWQTAINLAQGAGRATRAEDDYASVYWFDKATARFMKKYYKLMPEWILDGIKVGENRGTKLIPFNEWIKNAADVN